MIIIGSVKAIMDGLYDTIFIKSFTSTSNILTKLAGRYFNERKLFEKIQIKLLF